jgi:hypothetical protein
VSGLMEALRARGAIREEKEQVMDDVLVQNQRNRPHPLYDSTVTIQVWSDPYALSQGNMDNLFMCAWHQPWLPAAGGHLTMVDLSVSVGNNTSFNARVERINTRVNVTPQGTWTETAILCVRAGDA